MTLLAVTSGAAQQQEVLPRIRITSRKDLTVALVGVPDVYESRARLGLIAAQGSALLPWLRAIARDETERDRIRFCGAPADIPLIQAALQQGVACGREAGERSIVELRNPLAIRYLHTPLEGNYPPTGTFRPPPEAAAEIRAQLCDGPCPPGMVVLPSTVAKLHLR